jgi:hypothetical protein
MMKSGEATTGRRSFSFRIGGSMQSSSIDVYAHVSSVSEARQLEKACFPPSFSGSGMIGPIFAGIGMLAVRGRKDYRNVNELLRAEQDSVEGQH